ncbi:MAG: hypothetical protein QOG08_1656, partial [Chloroflexota bacterium]|nr:hypothetical protein [Chloroflexota bacterium]
MPASQVTFGVKTSQINSTFTE